jgi:crossover junction endodeoxyribonuclease RuvC
MENKREKVIIGIDPGTHVTGYAVVATVGDGRRQLVIDYGCIRPPSKALLSDRYLIIFESLEELLLKHSPDAMAIETPFIHKKNIRSGIMVGIAQGTAIIAAKKRKLPVFGYSPRAVKRSVVGTGKADKYQVQGAVARYLGLKEPPRPQDAADALAIVLCHIHVQSSALSQATQYEI